MYQHITEFQKQMQDENITIAVLRLSENLTLFSQYWPRNANSYLIIPAQGEPSTIIPIFEKVDTDAVGLDNVYTYNDVELSAGDPNLQILKLFKQLARQYKVGNDAKIGMELGYDTIAPCFCSGKVSLPGIIMRQLVADGFNSKNIVSVKDMLVDVMAIKTERDLEKFAIVNRIAAMAMDRFEELIWQEGIREIDVAKDIEAYIGKIALDMPGCRIARAWGQLSAGLKTVDASGEGMVSDTYVLQKGDCCMYEVGIVVDGYWADITRSTCLGGAEGIKVDMLKAIDLAFDAGVAAAYDGAIGRDVDLATRKVIEEAGFGQYYLHAGGHGVGFTYHEPTPELNPNSNDILRENMIIAIEPGIYIPNVGGFRKELNVIVGKDKGTVLGW